MSEKHNPLENVQPADVHRWADAILRDHVDFDQEANMREAEVFAMESKIISGLQERNVTALPVVYEGARMELNREESEAQDIMQLSRRMVEINTARDPNAKSLLQVEIFLADNLDPSWVKPLVDIVDDLVEGRSLATLGQSEVVALFDKVQEDKSRAQKYNRVAAQVTDAVAEVLQEDIRTNDVLGLAEKVTTVVMGMYLFADDAERESHLTELDHYLQKMNMPYSASSGLIAKAIIQGLQKAGDL